MKRTEGMEWVGGREKQKKKKKKKGERDFAVVLSYWTFSPRIGRCCWMDQPLGVGNTPSVSHIYVRGVKTLA